MRLTGYVFYNFLIIFITTFFVVTFTMCLLSFPKIVEIMSKGIELDYIGIYFLNLLSYLISYSIPISALFASLLLFGRLSVDNELNAMRSSGLSLWQITSPVVLIGIILSIFCIYNNSYIYPHKRYANRVIVKNLNVNDPIKLLDEGRSVRDFPGYIIYVKEKQNNRVFDLIIYEIDEENKSVKNCIQAKEGLLRMNDDSQKLFIDLYDARIEQLNSDGVSQYAATKRYSIPIDLSNWSEPELLPRSRRDMTLPDLIIHARSLSVDQPLISGQYWVRVHQRIYLGLAPLTFIMIGIPLGIRSNRRESSAGIILSILVIFCYYCLILIADALDNKPYLKSWLIPWIGTVIAQFLSILALKKLN